MSGRGFSVRGMDPLDELTPALAFALRSSEAELEAWLRRHDLSVPPRGFFGRIAALAYGHEEEQARRSTAAARKTPANRRRRDLDELALFMEKNSDRLSSQTQQIYALCIGAGRPLREVAATLELSVPTVRYHLKRVREMVRRVRINRESYRAARSVSDSTPASSR
jgi:DNA-directed RNA polymerase specialized sigma24 family protein